MRLGSTPLFRVLWTSLHSQFPWMDLFTQPLNGSCSLGQIVAKCFAAEYEYKLFFILFYWTSSDSSSGNTRFGYLSLILCLLSTTMLFSRGSGLPCIPRAIEPDPATAGCLITSSFDCRLLLPSLTYPPFSTGFFKPLETSGNVLETCFSK